MENKEDGINSRIMKSRENYRDLRIMKSKKDHGSFIFALNHQVFLFPHI